MRSKKHPRSFLSTVAAAVVLGALLPACLDTEEEIEVRPDGSVEVTVSAHGDAEDLAAGHPVPTHGPWQGADAGSAAWLGGAPAPRRDPDEEEVAVSVRASFASVADLPEYFAPSDALYRTAYLERRTSLEILPKGRRTVYVFERRLSAKARPAWSPNERIMAEIPEEVSTALDDGLPVSPQQWQQAVRTVQTAYGDAFDGMAHHSLLAVYLEGDADLSVDGCERARAAVREAVVTALDEPRLQRLTEFLRAAEANDEDVIEVPLDVDFDQQARAAARRALPAALEAEGLRPEVANAVLERLEWAFSAVDDATDRSDETLRVKLRLPGRLVGGTYDAIDASGRAVWELKEEAWKANEVGEIVLRAISVLE